MSNMVRAFRWLALVYAGVIVLALLLGGVVQ
jgi:hypothetical protein